MLDRIKLCAIAAAIATTLTGEAFAQSTGSTSGGSAAGTGSGISAPAPAGGRALSSTPATGQAGVATPTTPAATQPTASKGRSAGATTTNGSTITGGVPAISGVTPNRAELASSAFTKLDGGSRGYLTAEDVRQLDGFETAFRQADQNGDGRLNASEFNAAWSTYTGNAR